MESHEVLRRAVEPVGAKKVAHDLKVSTSLVYKWCEEDTTSGARNPLDRVQALIASTESPLPVAWLCRRSGGFFVQDPTADLDAPDAEFLDQTQRMLRSFSELLQVVSESMANDGHVDKDESARIREEWEELKSMAERFVLACERGVFDRRDD